MSSAPITFDDVATAAEAVVRSGRTPSSVSVREQLGRGSFSTIKKHLDRWAAERSPEPAETRELPAQLEALWREARKEAEQGLAQEREALEALSADLDRRWQAMEAQVTAAEAKCQTAELRLADRSEALAQSHASAQEWKERATALEQNVAAQADAHAKEQRDWIARLDAKDAQVAEVCAAMNQLERQLRGAQDAQKAHWQGLFGVIETSHQALVSALRNDQESLVASIDPPLRAVIAQTEEVLRLVRQQRLSRSRGARGRHFSQRSLSPG